MKSGDIVGLVVVVIVFALFGWLLFFSQDAPEIAYMPVDLETGSIEVLGQSEDGLQVMLAVETERTGWVSIHESLSGAPAEVIGVSELLEPGKQEITVDLDYAMNPGFQYITLLKVDNGDGRFVAQEDLPVRVNGSVVRPDFTFKPGDVVVPIPGTDEVLEINE